MVHLHYILKENSVELDRCDSEAGEIPRQPEPLIGYYIIWNNAIVAEIYFIFARLTF